MMDSVCLCASYNKDELQNTEWTSEKPEWMCCWIYYSVYTKQMISSAVAYLVTEQHTLLVN